MYYKFEKKENQVIIHRKDGFGIDGHFEVSPTKKQWYWWAPCGGVFTSAELRCIARQLKKVETTGHLNASPDGIRIETEED